MISYSENVFLGLPIDIYSHILAVGVLVILCLLTLQILLFSFSQKFRAKLLSFKYTTFIKVIGLFSLFSTVFALTYQWGYGLQVCELCWWQRIFMFPIEFIALSALIKRNYGNQVAIRLLSMFGIFFAGYHYWLHYQSWVLQRDDIFSFTSCSQGGILPSCTDPAGVVIFGFLTIPFMALVIFLVIFWLTILAGMREKIEKNAQK